jgi:polyisoprenoid-binding protein YceI
MKKMLLTAGFLASTVLSFAQDIYQDRTAKVSFFSKTTMENIDAKNNEATSFLNVKTGDLVFAVLVKSFRFEKALMEEHFNENYMESTKYPKADFKGKITNLSEVNFTKDGEYKVKVAGNMTMHGVTKAITVDGVITVKGGKIFAHSKFNVKLADYKIERPAVVADKISETIDITVDADFEPKK